jgi:hypothetical protein
MFTYKIAQNEEDNDRIMSLIQKSYANTYSGFDYPKLISHPYFKQVEVESIMLFYEQHLVGTISILHNKYGGILPSEHLLNYICPQQVKGNVIEVGRIASVIDVKLNNKVKNKILPVLLWLGANKLMERKEAYFVCSIQNKFFDYLNRAGFNLTIINKGMQHENSQDDTGNYLRYDTKFIYANSQVCFDALSKMNLAAYVAESATQVVEFADYI